MIKKEIILTFLLFLTIGTTLIPAQCDKIEKKRIRDLLGAAIYDNHKVSRIRTFDFPSKEEYQINLFKGVVYKLIFDVSEMPEGVVINLHDIGNKRGPGKYELVFSSETAEKTENDTYEVTLEFPKKKLLVTYDVLDNTRPGCVSFVLGYYNKSMFGK